VNRRLQQFYTFSALRTNRTNNIKPLIFCLPDCSGTGACFCPHADYRTLPAKACFILKPYLYKHDASCGYLVADANYTAVRRSHLTTRLILLPAYTARGRRMLCFFKSFVDNNMYAVVRRSHLTTHLILLPAYTAHGRKSPCI